MLPGTSQAARNAPLIAYFLYSALCAMWLPSGVFQWAAQLGLIPAASILAEHSANPDALRAWMTMVWLAFPVALTWLSIANRGLSRRTEIHVNKLVASTLLITCGLAPFFVYLTLFVPPDLSGPRLTNGIQRAFFHMANSAGWRAVGGSALMTAVLATVWYAWIVVPACWTLATTDD